MPNVTMQPTLQRQAVAIAAKLWPSERGQMNGLPRCPHAHPATGDPRNPWRPSGPETSTNSANKPSEKSCSTPLHTRCVRDKLATPDPRKAAVAQTRLSRHAGPDLRPDPPSQSRCERLRKQNSKSATGIRPQQRCRTRRSLGHA